MLGIEPTGKRTEFTGISIYKVDRGRVVEEYGEEDLFGLLERLRT